MIPELVRMRLEGEAGGRQRPASFLHLQEKTEGRKRRMSVLAAPRDLAFKDVNVEEVDDDPFDAVNRDHDKNMWQIRAQYRAQSKAATRSVAIQDIQQDDGGLGMQFDDDGDKEADRNEDTRGTQAPFFGAKAEDPE